LELEPGQVRIWVRVQDLAQAHTEAEAEFVGTRVGVGILAERTNWDGGYMRYVGHGSGRSGYAVEQGTNEMATGKAL
jgi:hypothetical protein